MTISAAAIDLMVSAGASCAQLAIVARRHLPDIADTVDALAAAGAPVAVVAALMRAQASDCGAAAREAARRAANTEAQRECRARARARRAEVIRLREPELPLSAPSQPDSPPAAQQPSAPSLSYDTYDSDDPPLHPTPPHSSADDDGDDGGARVVSLISPAARELADEIGAIAGIDPDPLACPPGWCGAAMQVQSWLTAGWTRDAILIGVRTAMRSPIRQRDGPPATPAYFARAIARVIADASRPLPTVARPSASPGDTHARPIADRRPGGAARLAAQLAARRHTETDS